MIISILDYGSGNIKSVSKAVEFAALNLGKPVSVEVINNVNKIKSSDKIILPGQGSFKQCASTLTKMDGAINELNEFVIQKKKHIFGICVGMQLFADSGDEDGGHKGLGWIEGEVKKINIKNPQLKLPHMGWNEIDIKNDHSLFKNLSADKHFYFVHSYHFVTRNEKNVAASTLYQDEITVAVLKDNIFGTQFHPEKSQNNGIKILENFINW
jgi:imidazole glycerol-phosphate synthase subunit HisH